MILSRSYHGLTIDTSVAEGSNKIAYIILPERIDASGLKWAENISTKHNCNVVFISNVDWANDLTPWVEDGLDKKDRFHGHASFFLGNLFNDYLENIETGLKLSAPERTLIGTSLSGLFALWACHNSNAFTNIISISGSFWYEDFKDWVLSHEPSSVVSKIYIAIGEKEKKNKNPRLNSLFESTEAIVEHLKAKGKDVIYEVEPGASHFSPLLPRLDKALDEILDKAIAPLE